MKFMGVLCVFLALTMVFTPLLSLNGEKIFSQSNESQSVLSSKTAKASQSISVYHLKTGKVEKMSLYDYTVLSVCAEIPPSFEEQAIMAQAVACRSYALYMIEKGSFDKADISDDYTIHQGYISKDELKKRWGDKFDTYYKRISSSVNKVENKAIFCDGEIIQPAFFALCGGKTENASDIFGGDAKYLKSVVSSGDELAEDLTSVVNFSKDEFKSCCENLKDCSLSDDDSQWIGETKRTQAGAVKEIVIGDRTYSGSQAQKAFGLKSNNFTAESRDGSFVFTVIGNGHGVGMSQYGADYMARQGSSYEEILKHYYTGVEIVDY
ncbi:MAG: stage II sporulation protein D [Clostridia bacterium]|nr:stage II sporulation protein D [Clostridia bacterium]